MKKLFLAAIFLSLVAITTAQNTFFSSSGHISVDKSLQLVADNIINPLQGQDLGKIINSNTVFTVMAFPSNYYQLSFHYSNPNRFNIKFISNTYPIIWMNGTSPTNNIRGTILFESLFGELRATQ